MVGTVPQKRQLAFLSSQHCTLMTPMGLVTVDEVRTSCRMTVTQRKLVRVEQAHKHLMTEPHNSVTWVTFTVLRRAVGRCLFFPMETEIIGNYGPVYSPRENIGLCLQSVI